MAPTEGVQVTVSEWARFAEYDFSDPRDARRFLREFHFPDGTSPELVRRKDGVVINVLVLDDFGVCAWAEEIHRQYFLRGIGYVLPVDLH